MKNPEFVMLTPMSRFSVGPKPFKRTPEKLDQRSRTIPDDSFTIAELFNRLHNGAPLPLGLDRPISYGEEPTHNDLDLSRISRLDLTEVNDLKNRVSDTLFHLNERQTSLKQAQNDDKTTNQAVKTDVKPAVVTMESK